MNTSVPQPVADSISAISQTLDADVFLFSAEISANTADNLIKLIREKKQRRPNVVLVLATYGGSPDSAFRMTRILQEKYEKITLFIFGYCKSAGTLIAIGADELVISDFGELGPLDVQVFKDDELRRTSGLDLLQSLEVVGDRVFTIFEDCLMKTIYSSSGVITTKTAADIASSISTGLLGPITAQIDPVRLGEVFRSMDVAVAYGMRLNPRLEATIKKLVHDYPSHIFAIDYKEAKTLFENVRKPNSDEYVLENALYQFTRSPTHEIIIIDLGELASEDDSKASDEFIEIDKKVDDEDAERVGENGRDPVGSKKARSRGRKTG
ncbi:MAG: hypothetical protein WBA86_11520 [Nodosilinea sp.]